MTGNPDPKESPFQTKGEVILFGGAFNPPTKAHEAIAVEAHKRTGLEVWFVPCYGHLFNKVLESPEHRLRMVDRVCYNNNFIWTCNVEIAEKHNGSTFDSLALMPKYFEKTFRIMMGLDNANIIDRWHRGLELIAKYPCVVVGRGKIGQSTNWFMQPPHIFIEMDLDLSSTLVRDAILNGNYDFAKLNVTEGVWKYIQQKRLYGYNEVTS